MDLNDLLKNPKFSIDQSDLYARILQTQILHSKMLAAILKSQLEVFQQLKEGLVDPDIVQTKYDKVIDRISSEIDQDFAALLADMASRQKPNG